MELNESSDWNYNSTLLFQLNRDRRIVVMPVIVFLFVNMAVGAIGNLLVIIVYTLYSKRTVTTYYISLVASLDITCCCLCLPFEIFDYWNPYVSSLPTLCRVVRFIENATNIMNGFVLVCVASERYCKICFPLEPYSHGKAKAQTIVISIMTIVFSWPQLLFKGKQTLIIGKDKVVGEDCSYNDQFKNSIYVFLFQAILYILWIFSMSLAFYFYFNITVVIIKRKRKILSRGSNNTTFSNDDSINGGIKMRSSKTTLSLASITITAILTYVPVLTVQVGRTSGKYFQTTITPSGEYYHYGDSYIVDLICCFCVKSYFLNSSLNPIIYSIMNPIFREKVKYAFGISRKRIFGI